MPVAGAAAQESEQPASLSLELLQGGTFSVASAAAQDWDRPVSYSLCLAVLFVQNHRTSSSSTGHWATCHQLIMRALAMTPPCWQHRMGASL